MTGFRLSELAQQIEGNYQGDPHFQITGIAPPDTASSSELVFLLDRRWLKSVQTSAAQVVLISKTDRELVQNKHCLVVPHMRRALTQILTLFYPPPPLSPGIHPTAIMGHDCDISSKAQIGPYVVLGNNCHIGAHTHIEAQVVLGDGVQIGEYCHLYPQVTLYHHVQLGDRVIVHSGTRIGSDGYGFYPEAGQHLKIPQVGSVSIGDRVEIGANVTIDRGTVGNTEIGAGTKIDNLVQIGHNVKIGENSLLVAQVGISGSSKLGKQVTLAGQVGVAGHLKVGDGVIAAGKSGITKDIPPGLKISGFPAQEHRQELKQQAALRQLPELLRWWKTQA